MPSRCLPFKRFAASCGALRISPATSALFGRHLSAIVAGLLLACAFPDIGIAGLAWIAPGLILIPALGTSSRRSFGLGYVAGLTHYLISLSWLLNIPVKGFPILGWIALSAFLALLTGTWTCLTNRLAGIPKPAEAGPTSLRAALLDLTNRSWTRRTAWALSSAALWVALEMLIARIFGGFPWNLLGASQFKLLPLIQISSVTAVYGISFLIVWCSVSLLSAFAVIIARPQARSPGVREIAAPFLAASICMAFGLVQLRATSEPERTLRVTLLQPSIPQTMIWDSTEDMNRFAALMQLSREALTNRTDLLIWPEAAIPKLLRYERDIFEPISQLVQSNRLWMIVGADDAEPNSDAPQEPFYYNSSFLLNPDGRLADRYRKRALVMFGEYVPLERWISFMKKLTPITGGFTPGDKAVPFEMRFPVEGADTNEAAPPFSVKTSVLICFEDNFPHLVRQYVEPDTDFLVNLTNNGWFGEGAAQWQHAANAIFRAIENGLPLIRCSNNGLTCWVDSHGRIRDFYRDATGSIYSAGYLTAEIPLLNAAQSSGRTIYHRYGDWFGWSCAALALARIAFSFRRRSAL